MSDNFTIRAPEPTALGINRPDGSNLFTLYADGTVDGSLADAAEAAQVFVAEASRLMADEIAAAEKRGAVKALREEAKFLAEYSDEGVIMRGDPDDDTTWYAHPIPDYLTDRADQIEKGDHHAEG